MKRSITLLNGSSCVVELPDAQSSESVFLLSTQKVGSVLFHGVAKDICEKYGKPYFDFEGQLFRQGVPMGQVPAAECSIFEDTNCVFLGWRTPWLLDRTRKFHASKKLLLVRDPRDIAVSFYFSMQKSHTVPPAGATRAQIVAARQQASTMDADEFVRTGRSDGPIQTLRSYKRIFENGRLGNLVIWRYEDIIFEKRTWFADIAKHLGVELESTFLEGLLSKHDLRPETERPDAHVRQVTPGNYKKHLSPETTALLEKRFADVFSHYGYDKS